METLKTPSEYSVDFNRGFQRFSMANLEKGISLTARGLFCYKVESRLFLVHAVAIILEKMYPSC